MNEKEAYIRISELRAELNEANRRYYVDNDPVMSDRDFDFKMKELEALEKEYPQFQSADSPSQRVGSDLTSDSHKKDFDRVPHRYPMLSLGNTYDISEVEAFAGRAIKALGNAFTFSAELKFDGTAICLIYRHGRLFRALTRGDGSVGDDVTANVMNISNIPHNLRVPAGFIPTADHPNPWPDEFEIRGEIYMPWKAFDRLNAERERDEETPFANPRNAASGSLKLLDSNEVRNRGLECTLYHMLGENLPFATHNETLEAAKSWGLPVSDKRKICSTTEELDEYIRYWDTERKTLPFATDGIVFKINELAYQKQLGYTAKFPRWAVAYKFKAEQALTKLLSIDYQVGRTGAVTPVANLEPVLLSGTVVKRASLHNAEQMALLDIRIGDYVYVEKGGEIIPKITAVDAGKRGADALLPHFPDTCPDCGTRLVRDEAEAKSFCPNVNGCPTQIKAKLVHFLSRKAMNVIAGDATIEQLYNLSLVKSPADFYDLDMTKLMLLQGWKEKSAERFLNSLRQSKNADFGHILYALGIRYVGETTAKSIARHFGNIDRIAGASRDELLAVEDVGEVIADSILAYFADKRNMDIISRLKAAGLKFETETSMEAVSTSLAGYTIVVSGNFSIPRDEIKAMIAANGGKNSTSVSGKTTFLLAGEKPGPEKIRKAESLGIEIIDEDRLYELIGSIQRQTEDPEHGTGEQLSLF